MAGSAQRHALTLVARRSRALCSRRYAVAWAFLAVYCVSAIGYAALSPRAQAALAGWSSTNVHNLRAHPIGSLVASAFIPGQRIFPWLAAVTLALFTANKLLGNARAVLLIGAGHVVGTLVSEGIVAARIAGGNLPASAQLIVDVGPSYLVVSALAAAMLYGAWPYATAAGVCFAGLAGDIFGGLSHLDVAAVGHLTAVTTGVLLGGLLLRLHRGRPAPGPAPPRGVEPGYEPARVN